MCGITGYFSTIEPRDRASAEQILLSQTDVLTHRGPDSSGCFLNEDNTVGLGHRRLSILDLSETGNQPMWSASRRYCIVFNGEIYNFLSIRDELSQLGVRFRSTSDTEVVLAAVEKWGFQATLIRLNGMFAIALYDCESNRLSIARDRFGEKPLYYFYDGTSFVFGSELKAICKWPKFRAELDLDAVALFFRFSYVPAPYSIYKGVKKLEAGAFITVERTHDRLKMVQGCYWSMAEEVALATRDRFQISEKEIVNELDRILTSAVSARMISDVPLGAFLSGGIDSSLIVAIMQKVSSRPIKTFTIGSTNSRYDEAQHARQVSKHLGTDHAELYVSDAEAREIVPSLAWHYDEPFSDSSQIPTTLVSRLARREVTVALSGDAGDELFGGYNRYVWAPRLWRKIGWLPHSVKCFASKAILSGSDQFWESSLETLGKLSNHNSRIAGASTQLVKLAMNMRATNQQDFYLNILSHWHDPYQLLRQPSAAQLPRTFTSAPAGLSFEEHMMFVDANTYLSDDILAKVDRASMSTSLEVRVPFLDPEILRFAYRLPLSLKIRDARGKWILRELLFSKYIPKELIERPKQGFGIPIGDWMRGPLSDWVRDNLDFSVRNLSDIFEHKPIVYMLAQLKRGQNRHQHHLWDYFSFVSWYRKWMS
jgi:asparagine synthase (glutamine-hydrolysing)